MSHGRTGPAARWSAAALLALLASPWSCGYSTGLRLAPQYDSYGVEIFGRDGREAPVRNLERELAAAMTRSAVELVDGELLAPSDARVVFRGTISTYQTAGGVRSANNELLEQSLEIVVRAELWDRVRDEIVSGPVTASARVGFVSSNVTLSGQEAQGDAQARVLRNLADRLVIELLMRSEETGGAAAGGETIGTPPVDPGQTSRRSVPGRSGAGS